MPQPKKGTRFGGSPAHHSQILSNLATELFRHGRIRTTHAKARTVQPLAEKMITFAKRGDVHSRRQVLRVVRDRDVVHKLFADIGPAFATRQGGYTRVLKLGPRKGDAAPMALIELVEGVRVAGDGDLAEQPRRRWSLRRRGGGTLSSGARDREEELAAAVDRGETMEPEVEDDRAEEPDQDVEASDDRTAEDEAPDAREPSDADPDGVQADPAEVEARLAADEAGSDEANPDEASADETSADETSADETSADEDAPGSGGRSGEGS